MRFEAPCEVLVDRIITLLHDGWPLSRKVMHMIDTTFAEPSREVLQKILQNPPDSETDSIMELIFSPDEAFRVQLEEILERFDFHKKDEKLILSQLLSRCPVVKVYLPDRRGSFALELSSQMMCSMVSRLKIAAKPDPGLVRVVDESVPDAFRSRCKVRLRHARLTFQEAKTAQICRFFKNTPSWDQERLDCLDFFLDFLYETSDEEDLFAALAARKRFYIKHLQRVEAVTEETRGKNAETLMQQGIRISYLNKKKAIEKIRWINEISLAVFGKTDYVESVDDIVGVTMAIREENLEMLVKKAIS